MIKTEFFTKRSDNVILVKTYSIEKKYIKQVETGLEYDEAVDIGEKVGETTSQLNTPMRKQIKKSKLKKSLKLKLRNNYGRF